LGERAICHYVDRPFGQQQVDQHTVVVLHVPWWSDEKTSPVRACEPKATAPGLSQPARPCPAVASHLCITVTLRRGDCWPRSGAPAAGPGGRAPQGANRPDQATGDAPNDPILHGGRSFTSRRSTAEIATTTEPAATSTTKTTATIGPNSATAAQCRLAGAGVTSTKPHDTDQNNADRDPEHGGQRMSKAPGAQDSKRRTQLGAEDPPQHSSERGHRKGHKDQQSGPGCWATLGSGRFSPRMRARILSTPTPRPPA